MQTAAKQTTLHLFTVAPYVFGLKDIFVNMYMISNKKAPNEWVLIDAGLKTSAPKIKRMASVIFGEGSKPQCIILTHGHFDHVGSVQQLAEEWDIPVYAHYMERPYLTGRSSYPPPDASVGGGLMANMAFLYPRKPIDITERLRLLPDNDLIPNLPGWRYFHTPGHAPGHISLFRDEDKLLIAGDAFVTTNQSSVWSVMIQKRELNGPPKYFTTDWDAAFRSVKTLADLEPAIVATGHGKPMAGPSMSEALHDLARRFDEVARPSHGRYAREAALADENGIQYVPPKPPVRNRKIGALLLITAAVLRTLWWITNKRRNI